MQGILCLPDSNGLSFTCSRKMAPPRSTSRTPTASGRTCGSVRPSWFCPAESPGPGPFFALASNVRSLRPSPGSSEGSPRVRGLHNSLAGVYWVRTLELSLRPFSRDMPEANQPRIDQLRARVAEAFIARPPRTLGHPPWHWGMPRKPPQPSGPSSRRRFVRRESWNSAMHRQ